MMRFCAGSAMLAPKLMHIALHHRNVLLLNFCFMFINVTVSHLKSYDDMMGDAKLMVINFV